MLKGAQKRMIVVKTADSRIFEEAYFVMRGESTSSNSDMVGEANRIIESCTGKGREMRQSLQNKLLLPLCTFLGGSFVGCGITLAVMLSVG